MFNPAKQVDYIYFQHNGFDYRTDGETVQANDGTADRPNWHTTGSLAIVLKAREVHANVINGMCGCDGESRCSIHAEAR